MRGGHNAPVIQSGEAAAADRGEESGKRTYRYRIEFEKATILQSFSFDKQNQLAASYTEDIR